MSGALVFRMRGAGLLPQHHSNPLPLVIDHERFDLGQEVLGVGGVDDQPPLAIVHPLGYTGGRGCPSACGARAVELLQELSKEKLPSFIIFLPVSQELFRYLFHV